MTRRPVLSLFIALLVFMQGGIGGGVAASWGSSISISPNGPSRIEIERKRRAVRSATPFTVPAPVATADSYATGHSTQLSVPAPGVLANDILNSAVIVSYGGTTGAEQTTAGTNTPTAGGAVSLNGDGGFVYTPRADFSGTDSFRYVLVSAGGSSTATVTITVAAEPAADFVVTSPGFFFVFSGVPGQTPELTLVRGRTYRFLIQTTPAHPFEILDAPPGSVINNNIFDGLLIFNVPAAAANYQYHCPLHSFGNVIRTVAPTTASETDRREEQERNRRIVAAFHDRAFNQSRPREAAEWYVAPAYTDHDPRVGGGIERFVAHFEQLAWTHPGKRASVRAIVAEGDLVMLHLRSNIPGDGVFDVMEVFRLEAGWIVERWSVSERVGPAEDIGGWAF